MEEFEEVDVRRVRAEVLFEEDVDGGFEHERVVDGDSAHVGKAEPAWLATAGVGRVHDIVRDEEEGL